MNYLIKNLEDVSLSNFELMDLVNNQSNLITYDKLANVNSIDQILNPYGACIILFLTKENYGHWCCLFKINDKLLEFFDPYGYMPDEELQFSNGNKQPLLTKLLLRSKYDISYNHYRFQKMKPDVKTCGRHVAIRLLCRDLNLDQYIKFIKSSRYNPDEIVTLLTAMI